MMEQLRNLGLSLYEARTYAALVKIGPSTSSAAAGAAQVPYGKIYPVMDSLAAKGFIKLSSSAPKRFTAVEPRIILNSLLEGRAKELRQLRASTAALISALEQQEGEKPAIEKIQIIEGKKNYLKLSVHLHEIAKSAYRSVNRLPLYQPHLTACRRTAKRGVKSLVLTSQTDRHRVDAWKALGVELRFIEKLELRYTVIDDSEVVIRIGDSDRTGYAALLIRHPVIARVLARNFDRMWAKAGKI